MSERNGYTSEKPDYPRYSNTGVTTPRINNEELPWQVYTVDFLTLTTFNPVLNGILRETFFQFMKSPIKSGKKMQYDTMTSYDKNISYGFSYQRNKEGEWLEHNALWVSGSLADKVYNLLKEYEFNCTRIDLACTVFTNNVDYVGLYNELVKYVNAKLIQSPSPTLYVGSRVSDRYIRIYPHIYENNVANDRFEVEYKGKRAKLVFSTPDNHQGYLLAEIYRLTKYLDNEELSVFESELTGHTPRNCQIARKDKSRDIAFYLKVVAPYLRRIIENPDFREVIKYDLEQLDLF